MAVSSSGSASPGAGHSAGGREVLLLQVRPHGDLSERHPACPVLASFLFSPGGAPGWPRDGADHLFTPPTAGSSL